MVRLGNVWPGSAQLRSGARLRARGALAAQRQRRLDARAAEDVATRRGRLLVDVGEHLEADRALGRLRVVGGVLALLCMCLARLGA